MTASATPSTPLLRHVLRRLLLLLWRQAAQVVVLVILLALLALLALRWTVAERLNDWRPEVEAIASRAVGQSVRIGRLTAIWSGWRPAFVADNVEVHNAEGAPVITVERIDAELAYASLVYLQPIFTRLEVRTPRLRIHHGRDGSWWIGDLQLAGEGDGGALGNWLLRHRSLRLVDGQLVFSDAGRGTEVLLEQVSAALETRGNRHQIAVRAVPPAFLAAAMDFRAEFKHGWLRSATDWTAWHGNAFIEFPHVDLDALDRHVSTPVSLPFVLRRGAGAVRAWLDFDHGAVGELTADVALADLRASFDRGRELGLNRVSGRLAGRWHGGRREAEFTGLTVETADGKSLALSKVTAKAWDAVPGQADGGEITADRLDLGTAAWLAEHVPLPKAWRQLVTAAAPKGLLTELRASWQGPVDTPSDWTVQSGFEQLTLLAGHLDGATPARPGFANLKGHLKAGARDGELVLDSRSALLVMPGIWPDPALSLARLQAKASWQVQPVAQRTAQQPSPVSHVQIESVRLENADLAMSLRGSWKAGPTKAGTVDLEGDIERLVAASVARYMPIVTGDLTRKWLAQALRSGHASDGKLRLKGDLAHFPFDRHKDGIFTVTGKAHQVRLDVAQGWPAIEQIDGELLFDRASMTIQGRTGRIFGVAVQATTARIADLHSKDPLLEIDGNTQGPLQDYLRYLDESPVGGWIDHATQGFRGQGQAHLHLKLQIPLAQMASTRVQGALQLQDNELIVAAAVPPLKALHGQIDFSESGVSIRPTQGRMLNGAFQTEGQTRADGVLSMQVQGQADAAAVHEWLEFFPLDRLTGSAPWSGLVEVRRKGGDLNVAIDSSLQGMTLALPEPLHKPAGAAWPIHVDYRRDGQTGREEIRANIAERLAVRGERAQAQAALRLDVGIGDWPAPTKADTRPLAGLPARGTHLRIRVPEVQLDHWKPVLNQLTAAKPEPSRAANTASAMPERIVLSTPLLMQGSQRLDDVQAQADHDAQGWRVQFKAKQAAGVVHWQEPRAGLPAGKVVAQLDYLNLPRQNTAGASAGAGAGATAPGSQPTAAPQDTQSLPAVDLTVEQLSIGQARLGKLDVLAVNSDAGAAPVWRLTRLSIDNPDARLSANGTWLRGAQGGQRTQISFELAFKDAGGLLTRLGYADLVRKGGGKAYGELSWRGDPLAFDVPTLAGHVRMDIDQTGQFLKADPGLAKLIGVLNLQSLPRRISLDFRDVFTEGYSFDSLKGDVVLAAGIARTDNLKMQGPTAAVLLEGQADIAKETQDMRVMVLPELNAGIAPLVYAAMSHPAVGFGAFVAQMLLSKPLQQVFSFEYRVTGSWSEPVVVRTERRGPAPSGGSGAATAGKSGSATPASAP